MKYTKINNPYLNTSAIWPCCCSVLNYSVCPVITRHWHHSTQRCIETVPWCHEPSTNQGRQHPHTSLSGQKEMVVLRTLPLLCVRKVPLTTSKQASPIITQTVVLKSSQGNDETEHVSKGRCVPLQQQAGPGRHSRMSPTARLPVPRASHAPPLRGKVWVVVTQGEYT